MRLLAGSIACAGAAGIDPRLATMVAVAQHRAAQDDSTPSGSNDQLTLRQIADSKGFEIGCHIQHWYVPGMLDTYAREFNLALVGWDMYWSNLEPSQGNLIFSNPSAYADADARVQFAIDNGMTIRGADLVYAPFYPDWLTTTSFSRSELVDIVQRHIKDVMQHFTGKVHQWVVLNEYLPLEWHSRPDVLHEVIGDDLVGITFEAARAADSSALLLYNDGGNERPSQLKTRVTLDLIDRLRPKGLIDGVLAWRCTWMAPARRIEPK